MTPFIDRDVEGTPVHVLVVGVGWYGQRSEDGRPDLDTTILPELVGVGKSVHRVVSWWEAAGPERVNGRLASLEVLLSVNKEASPFDPPVRPANRANVLDAIERWRTRCLKAPPSGDDSDPTDAIAVLHWIGHGITKGSPYYDDKKDSIVFCEDPLVEGADRYLQGILVGSTLESLRRRKFAKLSIVFIDACRDFPDGKHVQHTHEPALAITHAPKRPGQEVLLYAATMEGAETHCEPTAEMNCGFAGGALFTEAAIDALSAFGAERRGDADEWAAYPVTVVEAINYRLDRWSKHLGVAHSPAQLGDHFWQDRIVRIHRPKAMVDIETDSEQEFSTAALELKRNGIKKKPFLNGQEWEADLREGTWSADGYTRTAYGRHRPIEGDVTARPPYWRAKVKVG